MPTPRTPSLAAATLNPSPIKNPDERFGFVRTLKLLALLKLNSLVALFRNYMTWIVTPFRRACTRSSSVIAWLSCRLIIASYRNSLSSSSFSGKKR
jgi:hypothetical protein